jgi:hypothetical protein
MKIETTPKNVVKPGPGPQSTGMISLNWNDNTSIQGLLDVVVGIMAEEYVRVARGNEGVFGDPGIENGDSPQVSSPRNSWGQSPFSSAETGMTARGGKK